MKTILLLIGGVILVLLIGVGFLQANATEGTGRITVEEREVSGFTAVDFRGYGELTIIQGERESLKIETDDNLLSYVQSTVSDGTLILDVDTQSWLPLLQPTKSIRYTLTVKTLNRVNLSGAGTIDAEAFTGDVLTLIESGAGTITIDQLLANNLTVQMSGAGKVQVAGQVTSQTVEMSGLGNYEAGDLKSEDAKVSLSGAGTATVWVTEHLNATHAGAGSIRYYGTPQSNVSSSGIGGIQSLGDK